MPQVCTVCSHPKTKEIEEQIIQGQPNTVIAERYGLDHQAVRRHGLKHLPDKLVQTVQDKEQKHAENILDGINNLLNRTKNILSQAEEDDHKRLALDAIREARSTYELLSKIAVKLEEYRRQDKQQKEGQLDQHIQQGLQALSDSELKALVQLLGKIHATDPDYELKPESKYIVEAAETTGTGAFNGSRNSPRQDKNTKTEGPGDELDELDDWDDFDLELDDTIPSEQTDPAWLVRERQRRGR